jgi:predicted lipid-binding transport protein (Tim44 family)
MERPGWSDEKASSWVEIGYCAPLPRSRTTPISFPPARPTLATDEESTLKTFLTLLFALITVSFLTIPDAEARRLGGGANLGKQTTMPKQAQPPAAAPSQTQRPGAAAPAAGGASRWLGPLAGLAAGGLLAALFFGGAFEGMTAIDWILVAALAFGAFYLFRSLRRRAPAPAAVTSAGRVAPGYGPVGGLTSDTAPVGAETLRDEAPGWFDGRGFAEAAKTHFIRLQAAWDEGDWQDIRTYTTPQLLAELQQERDRSAHPGQQTEVVTLNSELLQVRRDGDQVLASVRFSGLIREEAGGPAQAFDEVWHVQHAWSTRDGDWLIAGIQQVG